MVNQKIRKEKKRQKLRKRLEQKNVLLAASDFPFIQNDKVVQYIKSSKVMFVMRGLSGSGKSTIVEVLQTKYKNCGVCSADNYFYESGVYNFDINLLGKAHSYCQALASTYCTENKHVIIIDNTNVMRWEIKPYLELAVRHNYVVITVTPKTAWRWDPVELAKRNSHNVPEDVLRKKVKLFQNMIPLYYGWFMNEADSQSLLETGNYFYELCVRNCPSLLQVLRENAGSSKDGGDERRLQSYFKRTGSAGILHCTARFCRWGKQDGSKQYHERKLVKNACGKHFTLKITGLTITPRTLGARVQLDHRQLALWDNDPWDRDLTQSGSNSDGSKTLSKKLDSLSLSDHSKESEGSEISKCSKKKKQVYSANGSGTANPLVSRNPFSVLDLNDTENESKCSGARQSPVKGDNSKAHPQPGISAHVTLGFADGIRAQQTGPDILDIVTTATKNNPSEIKKLENATLFYFGDGRCDVRFDEFLEFPSIFSGFY